MKKKSDKIVILLIIMGIFMLVSWVVKGGSFTEGQFNYVTDWARMGLYDLLLVSYSALNYKIVDIIYILVVGGCYAILCDTGSYRKLVDKTARLIEGKEAIAMAIITFIMGAYVSISSNVMTLFFLVPFIVSVFLRNGCKKLTALSAGFGGMFIGILGMTFGTFSQSYLIEAVATNVTVKSLILIKIIIFAIAYILFNLFAILYLNKFGKSEDGSKYDIFCPEELDESKVKKRKRKKLWPVLILFGILTIVSMVAYINWGESFNINFFTDLHTNFQNGFVIADIPILSTLVGTNINGFGEFSDLLGVTFFVLVATIIVALCNKMSLHNIVKNFGIGAKKISKVAFIYGFAFVVLLMCIGYSWPLTLINKLFGDGNFNLLIFIVIAFIAQLLCGDIEFLGFTIGAYLGLTYNGDIAAITILWRTGAALALVIGPTSFLLLSALTYVDVPYTKWLKYIWKFAATFLLAIIVIFAVVIYM